MWAAHPSFCSCGKPTTFDYEGAMVGELEGVFYDGKTLSARWGDAKVEVGHADSEEE